MVTGARRGELLALRWRHIDLDAAMLTVRRNYVRAGAAGHDKDTKSHQMRRLSIDEVTVGLLRRHRESCEEFAILGVPLTTDLYVFWMDAAANLVWNASAARDLRHPLMREADDLGNVSL
jgi:integrase